MRDPASAVDRIFSDDREGNWCPASSDGLPIGASPEAAGIAASIVVELEGRQLQVRKGAEMLLAFGLALMLEKWHKDGVVSFMN